MEHSRLVWKKLVAVLWRDISGNIESKGNLPLRTVRLRAIFGDLMLSQWLLCARFPTSAMLVFVDRNDDVCVKISRVLRHCLRTLESIILTRSIRSGLAHAEIVFLGLHSCIGSVIQKHLYRETDSPWAPSAHRQPLVKYVCR